MNSGRGGARGEDLWNKLPDEVLCDIWAHHLTPRDFSSISLVSKRFHAISADDEVCPLLF